MRYVFIVALLCSAHFAYAHLPVVVSPTDGTDIIEVERPEVSWAYYGELTGFSHTYEIRTSESITLYTHLLEPDIQDAEKNHNALIVRERDNKRGVDLVKRMNATGASWDSFYEFAGGDSYLSGPEFEQVVGPGVYRIEVSNAENNGKYVLVIGQIEDFSGVGYFETVGRIYEVKRFFGKPPIAMIQSPFVYVPTGVIALIVLGIWWWRKRRQHG